MSIALLCPTRSRAVQYQRMIDSINSTVSSKIIVMSGSNGEDDYANQKFPLDCPTVFMWNRLAEQAMKKDYVKLFMLAADDMIFATPGWDSALIDHYNNLENKIHVYALKDSRDHEGTPHPLVTREYIDAMGYFLPPVFMHWFVDTWTVEIAKAGECFTHFKDFELIHDKPNDVGRPDFTHNHPRKMGWLNRDQEVDRTCKHILEYEKRRLENIMMSKHHEKYRMMIGAA